MTAISITRLGMVSLIALSAAASAGDWPQWRGPARDGVAIGETLPATLPKELKKLWSVEVGGGHSSPVVADGRVILMARQEDREGTLALDATTGKQLWRDDYDAPYRMDLAARGHGKGPKATVTIDGDLAYAFGISEILSCYETATGKLRWRKDFKSEFENAWPEFGTSSSVLVDGDLVIAQIGRDKKGGIVAYNKITGDQVWRTDGDGPAYASPMAFDLAGVRQIVTFTQNSFAGFDAKDGRQLWAFKFSTPYQQNIPTPVVYGGDTIIYSGLNQGVAAIKLEPAGDESRNLKPVSVWKAAQHDLYMSSPVIKGDHLYFMSENKKGIFVCLDLKTGKTVWESEGRFGENASVILAGDRLLALNTDAVLKVIGADPAGYKELASYPVANSATWAHLALANGKFYVKDKTKVTCFSFD
jgi:outer membrane protein assembly factor BamB